VTFRGWPAAAVDFYDGLDEDNSKAYWTAHKAVYDEAVRAPLDALLAELAPEFGVAKVFRPHRDVRFSKDKSPYKDHVGAICTDEAGRVCYVQLGAVGLMAGGGWYELAAPALERLRRAIADDRTGPGLQAVVAAMGEAGLALGGAALKTAPRGYPRDHARVALLRQKAFYGYQQWPVAPWLSTPGARDRVVAAWRACRPLQDWIAVHANLKG
jgi:uncharacterized protein (TIGR02453 family)